jgi:hypothetical protein
MSQPHPRATYEVNPPLSRTQSRPTVSMSMSRNEENEIKWSMRNRPVQEQLPSMESLNARVSAKGDTMGTVYNIQLSKFDEKERNARNDMQRHIQWLRDMRVQLGAYQTTIASHPQRSRLDDALSQLNDKDFASNLTIESLN